MRSAVENPSRADIFLLYLIKESEERWRLADFGNEVRKRERIVCRRLARQAVVDGIERQAGVHAPGAISTLSPRPSQASLIGGEMLRDRGQIDVSVDPGLFAFKTFARFRVSDVRVSMRIRERLRQFLIRKKEERASMVLAVDGARVARKADPEVSARHPETRFDGSCGSLRLQGFDRTTGRTERIAQIGQDLALQMNRGLLEAISVTCPPQA